MPQFPEKTWVRDGLVSYWPLDNEQLVGSPPGATVRDVIGGNDGVTSGTITTGVTGKINEAFDFDGGDDYVAVNNLVYNGTNYAELTLSAWVKTSSSAQQIINSWDRSEYWRFAIDTQIYVGYYNASDSTVHDIYGNTSVNDGNWHHVVFRFDHGAVTMFLDGEEDGSFSHGEFFGSGVTRYGFISNGSEASSFDGNKGPTAYFNGEIDEVMIFDRALTQTEVKALYRRGVAYPW